MPYKRFNVQQMQVMVDRHGSDQNIADALGTTRQNIQHQRRALGIKPYRSSFSKRNVDVLKLRTAGWIVRELSVKFELSERQIKRIIKEGKSGND